MTKFYFRSLLFYTDSLFPKAVRGKSSNRYDCYCFTVNSLIDMKYLFIGNCKFFHQFSTKYSLNNNITELSKNVFWIILLRTSLIYIVFYKLLKEIHFYSTKTELLTVVLLHKAYLFEYAEQ